MIQEEGITTELLNRHWEQKDQTKEDPFDTTDVEIVTGSKIVETLYCSICMIEYTLGIPMPIWSIISSGVAMGLLIGISIERERGLERMVSKK